MSMYDLMFKPCPLAPYLLKGLDLDPHKLGRLRDCYFNEDCTRIVVFTRNGGNNRGDYQEAIAYMYSNKFFDRDYDEDLDSTYATFEFKIPEVLQEVAVEAKRLGMGYKPFKQRFDEMLEKLKSGKKDDPDVKRMTDNFKPLGEALEKFISGDQKPGHTNIITV